MEEPNFFTGEYFFHQKTADVMYNNNTQFMIDDLLVDFPNHDDDDVVLNDEFFDNVIGNSTDSSTVTGSEGLFSGNVSSRSFSDSHFSGVELCVPYDDVAELEWLSTFTQDSFSTVDVQNLHVISAVKKSPATDTSSTTTTTVPYRINSQISQHSVFVPSKARSKRSRTAPYDWTSRILHLKQPLTHTIKNKDNKTTAFKRHENSVMKCLHCGSEKTPQWRTGPMGPKTLCNACGVRYKSGRLVSEYRPAASPTFMSARHSNSHRKVMEIRRQKELRLAQSEFANRSSGLIGSGSNGVDDCLIDRQCGPGFVHMI